MYSTTPDSRHSERTFGDEPIRVAIADDYPVLLAGLRHSLKPWSDVSIVAESTHVEHLLSQVALHKPDVILLGCEAGLDLLAQHLHAIAERHPAAKVIVFTRNSSLDFHEEALRNGAKGVLLKRCEPDSIGKTVKKVHRGDLCFDRALTDRMLNSFVRCKQPQALPAKARISSLTGRESQVMSRICQGMRNKEIASKLYISDATVAHHLTSIYRKLGLADRTELLLYAHQNGISSLRAS